MLVLLKVLHIYIYICGVLCINEIQNGGGDGEQEIQICPYNIAFNPIGVKAIFLFPSSGVTGKVQNKSKAKADARRTKEKRLEERELCIEPTNRFRCPQEGCGLAYTTISRSTS